MKKIVSVSVVAVLMTLSGFCFSVEEEKKVTFESKPFVLAERGPSVEEDFGQCRDRCYRQRSACFDSGQETEVCESQYDNCAARCN